MTAVCCPEHGVRCHACEERMCSETGPEPAIRCAAHATCTSCAEPTGPSCRDCLDAIRDHNEGTDW